MKKLLATAALFAITGISLTSCKKDSKSSGPHTVQYKVSASSNVTINAISYTDAEGNLQTDTKVNQTSWQSDELTMPASVLAINFNANGTTNDPGDKGTISIQIIVDGKVVKTNTGTGNVLSAMATYSF